MNVTRALLLVLGSLLVSSCGEGSPSAPSGERVSGAWMGHSTLTAVSGGECVGSTLQASLARRDIFAALVRQTGNDLSASINFQGNQTSCEYTGAASGTSVNLTRTSCVAGRVVAFKCSDGSLRDLEMASSRVTAQAGSGTGRGTDTTTWNVFASGSSVSLGAVTLSSEFTWNVLGIPHNDFHLFDGSVLAGYVDGVVVIPQEDTPFCTSCGWF